MRAERQKTAPAARVDAGALLDDNDIVRAAEFDGGRAKMTRRRGCLSHTSLTVIARPAMRPSPERCGTLVTTEPRFSDPMHRKEYTRPMSAVG